MFNMVTHVKGDLSFFKEVLMKSNLSSGFLRSIFLLGFSSQVFAQGVDQIGKWQCEATGRIIYSDDPGCPYYCSAINRQVGDFYDSLPSAQQGAKDKVVRVAKAAGWSTVRELKAMYCAQLNTVSPDAPSLITVKGWSRDYAFLFDFAAGQLATEACREMGGTGSRLQGRVTAESQSSGDVLLTGLFRCY
jgi:hypothetical protein